MNETTFVAPTLASRLACACNCAYGICTETGGYSPPRVYDPGVGWRGTPTAVSAPEAGQPDGPRINACLIGRNGDGIILAFRGTLPPAWTVASLEDWWQDIVDSEPVSAPPLPGKVHSGFLAALNTIWEQVLQAVLHLRAEYPSAPVLVTGHSKGGPLASIGAARLHLAESVPVGQVTTFASPHPGDRGFVAGYPSDLPITRFENYLDLVPFLPPTDAFFELFDDLPASWRKAFCDWFPPICRVFDDARAWRYQALGTLAFVTSDGQVVDARSERADPCLRLIQIIGALFGLGDADAVKAAMQAGHSVSASESGLSRIGAAHCIACKCSRPDSLCAGGYMSGAGGDAICPGH